LSVVFLIQYALKEDDGFVVIVWSGMVFHFLTVRFTVFPGNYSWAGLFISPAAEECPASPATFVPLPSLSGEESIRQSAQQFTLALDSLKQVCNLLLLWLHASVAVSWNYRFFTLLSECVL
jgi:hypothetical protein